MAPTALKVATVKRQTSYPVANRRAFTLIEVTVVISIIVILASMLTPRILSMRDSRAVQTFVDGLPRIVSQAREAAASQGGTSKLTYDSGQQQLHVALEKLNQQDTDVANLPVPSNVQLDSFQLQGQPSSAGDWTLRFYSDGHCDGGGIETNDANRLRSCVIDTNGTARLVDGPLPQAQQDNWPAGDFVHRTS